MPQNVPFLTVFLSSPGDVAEERILARKIMKRLPNRYVFKGRVGLNVVAWDDPDSTTAMEATLTPQAAINKGLPMPSQSDIVIIIFWSRMGTPFTDETDGQQYQSGTHWELLDGLKSSDTKTYIYRRMQEPDFGSVNAPDYDAKVEQYRRVKIFLGSEMFYKDGQIKMAVHQYDTPSDFEEIFEHHFEEIVFNILEDLEQAGQVKPSQPIVSQPQIEVIETEPWDASRSPFPGLRSLTEADADIFFGRSRETDALVQQIKQSRFVAVVGASGSGKSSLTAAGLIPRLRANAIAGSKDWFVVAFTPSDNPFEALAAALMDTIPALAVDNPRKYAQELDDFAQSLQEKPDRLAKTLQHALKNEADWAEVLFFVDQFEELLTLTPEKQRKPFAEMLAHVGTASVGTTSMLSARVVLTMRADFYHRMLPLFETELRNGSFTLSVPKRDALRQMIERPAERAGVTLEDGLVERILDDTGDEPGALALMAYLLDEIYNMDDDKILTHAEYDQLGGVAKAIGTRAENIFMTLPGEEAEKEQILWRVFRELVEVDENGTATRRRVPFDSDDESVRTMIYAFADARLLTTNQTADGATVEVAHEALLREWNRLADWIHQRQHDLRLWRQLRDAAREWHERENPDGFLWRNERLGLVREMVTRLMVDFSNDKKVKEFVEASHNAEELGKERAGTAILYDVTAQLIVAKDIEGLLDEIVQIMPYLAPDKYVVVIEDKSHFIGFTNEMAAELKGRILSENLDELMIFDSLTDNTRLARFFKQSSSFENAGIVPIRTTDKVWGFILVIYERKHFDITAKVILKGIADMSVIKLQNIELMKQLNFLTAMIVHDLRGPLSSIITAWFILADEPLNLTEDQKTLFNIIHESADGGLHLVNDILDFKRIENGKFVREQVRIVIESLVKDIRDRFMSDIQSRNQTYVKNIEENLPDIWVASIDINQALSNLISNASKYTPNNGIVTLNVQKEGSRIRFTVEDTGIGFSKEDIKMIGTPFWRSRNNTTKMSGTGLGLSIVEKSVNAMGSKLEVKSEIGKGSSFSFTVAIADDGTNTS